MNRRGFLIGLTSLVAAPAIVRASSLMPVRAPKVMTLADYAALLEVHMARHIERWQQDVCDVIMSDARLTGTGTALIDIVNREVHRVEPIRIRIR